MHPYFLLAFYRFQLILLILQSHMTRVSQCDTDSNRKQQFLLATSQHPALLFAVISKVTAGTQLALTNSTFFEWIQSFVVQPVTPVKFRAWQEARSWLAPSQYDPSTGPVEFSFVFTARRLCPHILAHPLHLMNLFMTASLYRHLVDWSGGGGVDAEWMQSNICTWWTKICFNTEAEDVKDVRAGAVTLQTNCGGGLEKN